MDYYDYDAYGGVDDLTFQVAGYGGFGYDTSHVKPDEVESPMVQAAKEGNVDALKIIFDAAKDDKDRRVLLNHARQWTEVDYRASGFTKEYEWFGLTPVAHAALKGHVGAVDFFLKKGADPTLRGCLTEDVHYCAYSASEARYKSVEGEIFRAFSSARPSYLVPSRDNKNKDPHEYVEDLFQRLEDARKCQEMVQASKTFWKNASYGGSGSSVERSKSGYSNRATDQSGLTKAVEAAKHSTLDTEEKGKIDKRKEYILKRLLAGSKECSRSTTMTTATERAKRNVEPGALTGSVKCFKSDKGYGFIIPDEGGEDVFFHLSSVDGDCGDLKRNASVQYQTEFDHSGRLRATKVII